jgi:hypothetical protein
MTRSNLPPQGDRRFARDVAKLVDRRRVRRRLMLWTALLAVVAAAAMYLRCGHGFGLGGDGKGEGPGEGPGEVQPLLGRRCVLRIAASGITVDGKRMPRDQAVAACRAIGGAEVIETGDAPEGSLIALHRALEAAGVAFSVRNHAGGAPPHQKP